MAQPPLAYRSLITPIDKGVGYHTTNEQKWQNDFEKT
jgi:hypothetical protein